MVVFSKNHPGPEGDNGTAPEQDWDNPTNPEKASDQRDLEQLERQKEEALRRNQNLEDSEEDE